VEHVEHVGVAELDPHRPAPIPFRRKAVHAAVDAAAGHAQRHALGGPSRDAVERGTNHTHQVPFVPAAQIAFDRAAVLTEVARLAVHSTHRTSPAVSRTTPLSPATTSAPLESTSWAVPRRVPPGSSHSTRRPNVVEARSRHAASTSPECPAVSISYRRHTPARHSASTAPRWTARPSSASS